MAGRRFQLVDVVLEGPMPGEAHERTGEAQARPEEARRGQRRFRGDLGQARRDQERAGEVKERPRRDPREAQEGEARRERPGEA